MKESLKLLLIEDNIGDAELFREMVDDTAPNCTLRIANHLSSGLKLLREESFDVVFLDLGLPDSSGIDTLRRLQEKDPNVPVIVLTILDEGEIPAKAISVGAQDYLIKGKFDGEILFRSVVYARERKRNEVDIRQRKEMSDALNYLDSLIHSTLDFDLILKGVAGAAAGSMGIEASVIGTLEDDDYVIRHVYNMPVELAGRRMSAGELKSLFRSAAVNDVVAINDPHDERLNLEIIRTLGIRSLLISPFVVRGNVMGAISFCSLSTEFIFSDIHIDFARRLSASISTALENAGLYDALKASEQVSSSRLSQLEAIYATAPVGLCFVDAGLRYVNINERLAEMYGASAEEHIGKRVGEVLPETERDIELHFQLAISTGKAVENVEIRRASQEPGGERYWLSSYYPVVDAAGKVAGVNAVVQEITARKIMEEEIRHLANHDALTGLPNRRLFLELFTLERAQARRHGSKVGVFFLDIDRFKNINDTLGHEAGDELLREVGAGLKRTVRESDTVARIGGDEFNLIIADINRAEDAVDIVRKVLDYFQKTFSVGGQELHVTASIGISIFPDDGEEIDSLLRYADIALYHAKALGRNNYQFYDPKINIRSLERMRLENRLGRSIERAELFIHYQPQVSIRSGKIMCVEALVRWRHPELGLIDPAEFIPLAEETGLIVGIDEWVLRSVCSQAKAWQDAGLPMRVTVNLSARLLTIPMLVETVERILRETGMEPHHLEMDVTESAAMSNPELMVVRLKELVDLGIHISIDDFGTGYCSLNYLKKLPVGGLKIDKSFVQAITTDPDDRIIINAVTAMAHSMKMKVIAEGVETEDQLSFLSSAGCDEMEGFLFSKPLPAEEFKELAMSGGTWGR